MARGFYTQAEAMEKLVVTEEELRDEVRKGTIREYRDGGNFLYKVEEVEALLRESQEAMLKDPEDPETEAVLASLAVSEEHRPNPVLQKEKNKKWWEIWK